MFVLKSPLFDAYINFSISLNLFIGVSKGLKIYKRIIRHPIGYNILDIKCAIQLYSKYIRNPILRFFYLQLEFDGFLMI